jgi:hypothetical protein
MNVERLWKVAFFPNQEGVDRQEISSEKWIDFSDFLSNGSDEVYVVMVKGEGVMNIKDGNLLIIDRNLAPEIGDAVTVFDGETMRVKEYASGEEVFAVVTCIGEPLPSHFRQRTKRAG